MSLKLLIDENVDFRIVKKLQNAGFKVILVSQNYKGISDIQVLELAKKFNAILVTEDSDFGEWVFAHNEFYRSNFFEVSLPKFGENFPNLD